MGVNKSQVLFLFSFVAVYVFFNTCRRLLVAIAPSLILEDKLTQDNYGLLSSLSSIIFGVCRFVAYQVLDWVPIDKYLSIFSILTLCICGMMSLFTPEDLHINTSVFYGICFVLLFISVGLPFPCSSMIVREYISPSWRNFLWSIIAISSCVGSIVAFNLAFFVHDRSRLFQYVIQFGISCTISFYVFFPSSKYDKEKKTETQTKRQVLSISHEFLCIILCIATYFLTYLTRRIIAEWTSIYTKALFDVSEEQIRSMYTLSNSIFEGASVVSLIVFGWMKNTDSAKVMAIYLSLATLFISLPLTQLSCMYYASSVLTGFFLSVPYASLELVIMDICSSFNINRVLSIMSLSSQVAAAVAGYPTSLFFSRWCSFYWAPAVQGFLLVIASCCMWLVVIVKKPKKEKED